MKLAAVLWSEEYAYFFKADEYIRWNVAAQRPSDGYPRKISGNWSALASAGFTSGIDVAVPWPGTGKAYFFKGSEYIRVNTADKTLDPTYPRSINGNWAALTAVGWTSGIETAVAWVNGKAYFFKGTEYIRVNIADKALDPGYPRPIKGNWPLFGGVFGEPDVTVSYRQPANFYEFDKDPTGTPHTTTSPGTTGMFMVYRIDTAVNHVPGGGLGPGPAFPYDLSHVSVTMPDEVSGNTSLDGYLKEGPDQVSVTGDESVVMIGERIVVRVEGDSQSLMAAQRKLHYGHHSGWNVAMIHNPEEGDPKFIDKMTPEIAETI
jgi:hypothetical protein